MNRVATHGLGLSLLLGLVSGAAAGCVDSELVPPPPPHIDSSIDGQVIGGPVGTRRDLGLDVGTGSDDASVDGSVDAGCQVDTLDARVLFVLDRSLSMGSLVMDGTGLALNEVAAAAAADLLTGLPATSSAGLLLFPSQSFEDPSCPDVSPISLQFTFREPSLLEGALRDLWSMEGLVQGTPLARALERAAEAFTEDDLSDVLVVVLTDGATACAVGTPTDGVASLRGRGARVVTATLGPVSAAATMDTPVIYSQASEIVAALQPELDAVRRRCEAP